MFSNLSMDTLDYTGPVVNEGSKGVLLGLGSPVRELAREVNGPLPAEVADAAVFCGGCLVVSGAAYSEAPELAARLARSEALSDWPVVVLVDDVARTVKSTMNFLWTTFTRFEPAADLHSSSSELVRNHRTFSVPLVIDARRKPGFPEELLCDLDTAATVSRRWSEYFPAGGIEMGDSDRAHLD